MAGAGLEAGGKSGGVQYECTSAGAPEERHQLVFVEQGNGAEIGASVHSACQTDTEIVRVVVVAVAEDLFAGDEGPGAPAVELDRLCQVFNCLAGIAIEGFCGDARRGENE